MSELVKPETIEQALDEGAGGAPRRPVSRRLFLKGSGAALAAAGIGAAATAAVAGGEATAAQPATPAAGAAAGGMTMADQAAAFFNIHEAQTVDALVSRILPGTADDPGAHEAGVVFYIDRSLAGPNLGYDLKTYAQGPFLVTSDQPVSVEAASSRDIYASVQVATEQVARYGYQSMQTRQEVYRRGIGFVDAYAQGRFQKAFVDLGAAQQDAILADMRAGKATGFAGPSDTGFFQQLRNDTIEGMFSDPMYGGNQNLVGWKLIGYPGAQVNYAPAELKQPGTAKQPQSLAMLMAKEGH